MADVVVGVLKDLAVDVLAGEGLGHAHAGKALVQIAVHVGDLVAHNLPVAAHFAL